MASPAHRHRDRGLTLAAVAAMGLWLAAGCRERAPAEEEQAVAEEVKPQLEVGVSGCSGLVQDPERGLLCLTRHTNTPKPLHLWLHGARDPNVELRFSGAAIEPKRTVDVDGVMLSIELPAQQGELELSTDNGVWLIELFPVSGRFETLRKEVQESWNGGDAAAALQRLEHGMAELRNHEATLLACSVGKVVLAAGDHDRVLALAEQVMQSPVVSCVGKLSLLAAYVHIYLRPNFNAAERSLRIAESVKNVDLDTRIGAAYLRGVLEHRLGHIDDSLMTFEGAARFARLVGDNDQYASALVMQAVSLARLGRFAEAEALAQRVEQQAGLLKPSVALDIRASVGWIAVLRREDDPTLPDPSTLLREMIEIYDGRNDRRNAANRRLDLALTLVQNEDLDAAALELTVLEPSDLDPDLLVWYELTVARLALLRGHLSEAQPHLERARVLAELNQDSELEWRVTVSRAELERGRGRATSAIELFREASRLADKLALSVAGTAGRSRFVTTHSRADIALVELLLEQGDAKEAMCTAMAARARHLRGLWTRLRPPLSAETEQQYRNLLSRHQERKQAISVQLEHSWELSTEQLEALRKRLDADGDRADRLLAEATALLEEGAPAWSCEAALSGRAEDAVLTMFPRSERSRWTAMLGRKGANGDWIINIADVNVTDFESAADLLLARLEDSLSSARSLRVIPAGGFVDVDFHERWLAREKPELTVTYSLGLGGDDWQEPLRHHAAVVAGSTNLASVEQETKEVSDQLRDLGWKVDVGWSPNATSQPSLLHYAGHGLQSEGLGWQSAIEVPGVGRVSAAQIVASQRSPEVVVLGACSAGQVTSESIDGGMNLAAAFLLAGARLVIAPSRDVDDTAAFELAVGLYRDFDASDPDALVRALASLQREQLRRHPKTVAAASFNSWRAWTP